MKSTGARAALPALFASGVWACPSAMALQGAAQNTTPSTIQP